MKLRFLLLIALVLPATSAEISIKSDGRIIFEPKRARVNCQGTCRISHPEFEVRAKGQLVAFFTASLKLDRPGGDPSSLRARKHLGSIVALGDVTVTLSSLETVDCRRAVYVGARHQWLIDGKPWPGTPSP